MRPELIICDPDLKKLCYLNTFQYFFYQRNYYEMDTAEVTVSINSPQYQYCRAGNILLYKKNNITSAMYIVSEEEDTDTKKHSVRLKMEPYGLLNYRYLLDNVTSIVAPAGYDEQNDNSEVVMKHYVERCCVHPAQQFRTIPNFDIAPNHGYGEAIIYKGRMQLLSDALTEIGRASGMGWHCYYDSGTIYFDALVGLDQSEIIRFSEDDGNVYIKNSYYEFSPTAVIITDSVDGTGKTYLYQDKFDPPPPTVPNQVVLYIPPVIRSWWVNTTKLVDAGARSGLDRLEMLVECSDSSLEANMKQKGLEAMEEKKSVPSLEVRLIDKRPWEYMKDFFVGDCVSIKTSKYVGKERIVRVEEEIMGNGKMQYQMFIGKVREDLKTDIAYNNKIMMNEVRK
jgi:hypothetical protein